MKYIILVSLFALGACSTATKKDCAPCKIKKPVKKECSKKPCKTKKCKDACDIKKEEKEKSHH